MDEPSDQPCTGRVQALDIRQIKPHRNTARLLGQVAQGLVYTTNRAGNPFAAQTAHEIMLLPVDIEPGSGWTSRFLDHRVLCLSL